MRYVDVDEGSPVAAKGPVIVLTEALGQLVRAVHCAEVGGGCRGVSAGESMGGALKGRESVRK
jgi:hypothetical protein